jgi:hypothetical protein
LPLIQNFRREDSLLEFLLSSQKPIGCSYDRAEANTPIFWSPRDLGDLKRWHGYNTRKHQQKAAWTIAL